MTALSLLFFDAIHQIAIHQGTSYESFTFAAPTVAPSRQYLWADRPLSLCASNLLLPPSSLPFPPLQRQQMMTTEDIYGQITNMIDESKVVTYRTIANKFPGCDTNQAKQ
jgi:hypothetical protein